MPRDLKVNDIMESTLWKLGDMDPMWMALSTNPSDDRKGYRLLRKAINTYGPGTVTIALGRAWEGRVKVTSSAYGLLVTICKSVQDGN